MSARLQRILLVSIIGVLAYSPLSTWAQQYRLPLVRLDSIIYKQLEMGDTLQHKSYISPSLASHIRAAELIASRVLGLDDLIDSLGLQHALLSRYAHPGFSALYSDVEHTFNPLLMAEVHKRIQDAFGRLHKVKATMPLPDTLYTHVSGLSQRIVVAPGLISISLDYYLGHGYEIYSRFFSPWQRQQSSPDRVAFDTLLGWIISEMPEPRDHAITLDDKLRYWGEIYGLMKRLFPGVSEQDLFGLSKDQYAWLRKNRKHLIRNAKERGELSSPSPAILDKYFSELPDKSVLPPEAPRLIGPWLGYKLYGR